MKKILITIITFIIVFCVTENAAAKTCEGFVDNEGTLETCDVFTKQWGDRIDDYDIKYQSSQLSKVDQGGGGTIAVVLANRGMDVLDSGVPLLSMHSPYEATSKFDVYMSYLAYKVFMK